MIIRVKKYNKEETSITKSRRKRRGFYLLISLMSHKNKFKLRIIVIKIIFK